MTWSPVVLLPAATLALPVASTARAQTSYSREFWPELQFHHFIADKTKLIGIANHARGEESGQIYQAEMGVTLEQRFAELFRGRIGYRHLNATDGGSYYENRMLLEQIVLMPLRDLAMVEFRTREDFRWLDTGYSMRFRERIQVTHDTTIEGYTFSPYVSAEIFFDTRYDQISRYRLIAGSTFPIKKNFAFEIYFAHQVDVAPRSVIIDALSLVLYAYF